MNAAKAPEAVAWFLDRARDGDVDQAFLGLRELPDEALPPMEIAFRAEADPEMRSLLIAAWSQHRPASRIDFLAEALEDPSPFVWKEALDGVVALESVRAAEIVRNAILETDDDDRRVWLEEALLQVVEQLNRR